MNRKEFEQQVLNNQESLRRFLMNLCNGNSALSDDIAQEAFIKAYLNLNFFNGLSKFSTWLFRIAYNCYCDNRRANQRYRQVDIEDEVLTSNETTDKNYKNQELYMALAKLNEKERSVILLFYMEDKSIKEISKITDIPVNTVKSHLSRAKTHISEHLKTIGYEKG
ncbi:MAG: RNA polymerase sigma factor [Bacteroidales bacterium]